MCVVSVWGEGEVRVQRAGGRLRDTHGTHKAPLSMSTMRIHQNCRAGGGFRAHTQHSLQKEGTALDDDDGNVP